MKIETKFSIGDSVWVMRDGKPYSFRIDSFYISIKEGKPTVSYKKLFGKLFPESACYASKEELLASL